MPVLVATQLEYARDVPRHSFTRLSHVKYRSNAGGVEES